MTCLFKEQFCLFKQFVISQFVLFLEGEVSFLYLVHTGVLTGTKELKIWLSLFLLKEI